jgi:hypothetical protein
MPETAPSRRSLQELCRGRGAIFQAVEEEAQLHGEERTGLWGYTVAEDFAPLRRRPVPELLEAGFAELVARMEALSQEIERLQQRLADVEESFAAQPRCRQATLYDLGSNAYELKQPVTVQIEEYDDETVARMPELDAFASATTDSEALVLLKAEIASLYDELVSCPAQELGERPTAWLRLLKRLVNVAEAP